MKTIIKLLTTGALVFAGFEYASAQSAASSSQSLAETTENVPTEIITDTIQMDVRPERGIPTPPLVEKLLQEGKIAEALSEFEKFKVAQQKAKANPFDLLYCEMTIYQQAAGDNSNNKYAQKAESLKQEIIKNYPNISDTYILQIEEGVPDDKIIELATKAIELDAEDINAYSYRGSALFNIGKIKEACADFEKLPWKGNMPEYWQCKDLK